MTKTKKIICSSVIGLSILLQTPTFANVNSNNAYDNMKYSLTSVSEKNNIISAYSVPVSLNIEKPGINTNFNFSLDVNEDRTVEFKITGSYRQYNYVCSDTYIIEVTNGNPNNPSYTQTLEKGENIVNAIDNFMAGFRDNGINIGDIISFSTVETDNNISINGDFGNKKIRRYVISSVGLIEIQ